MKYLSILLHIYQPPTQLGFVVDDIAKECYQPLANIFNCKLKPQFTLNINYSLSEQLVERGHAKLIKDLRTASESGNLEFTDSGAYHPIFPLLPPIEVKRQLELNRKGNGEIFGPSYAPKGVFPPEMCFSSHLAQLFEEMDYKWCITDDLPFSYHNGFVPYNSVPSVNGVGVFLRSNSWANNISFHSLKGAEFLRTVKDRMNGWFGNGDGYLIIAMDGETFGHHHKYYEEKFLRSLLHAIKDDPEIKLVKISDLFDLFPMKEEYVPPSTWSASTQDLSNDDPYPLWHSKFNPIHHHQWILTNHIMALAHRASKTDPEARALLDKAVYSCQYWWASCWNWDPSQVFRGAFLLMDTLERAGEATDDREAVRIGRELYNNLVFAVAERLYKSKKNESTA